MSAVSTRSTLDLLVAELDAAVRSSASPTHTIDVVAAGLRPFLGRTDLLRNEQRRSDPTSYRANLLHAADDGAWSLVALVWLPGQLTPIHDHLTWCVVGVHEGSEFEQRFAFDASGEALALTGEGRSQVGTVCGLLPPGDIHRVRNDSDQVAVSLHVYGTDVRRNKISATRRCYDLPVL
jgi:predicted metal-dependent enzyme (double-stranded beta helix superfamily)